MEPTSEMKLVARIYAFFAATWLFGVVTGTVVGYYFLFQRKMVPQGVTPIETAIMNPGREGMALSMWFLLSALAGFVLITPNLIGFFLLWYPCRYGYPLLILLAIVCFFKGGWLNLILLLYVLFQNDVKPIYDQSSHKLHPAVGYCLAALAMTTLLLGGWLMVQLDKCLDFGKNAGSTAERLLPGSTEQFSPMFGVNLPHYTLVLMRDGKSYLALSERMKNSYFARKEIYQRARPNLVLPWGERRIPACRTEEEESTQFSVVVDLGYGLLFLQCIGRELEVEALEDNLLKVPPPKKTVWQAKDVEE